MLLRLNVRTDAVLKKPGLERFSLEALQFSMQFSQSPRSLDHQPTLSAPLPRVEPWVVRRRSTGGQRVTNAGEAAEPWKLWLLAPL